MRPGAPKLQYLHPFLFGMVSVVSLLAYNIGGAPMLHAVRPSLASLLLTVALLALFYRLVRDWEHASLLTSLLPIIFFSYGHIYSGLIAGGPLAVVWRVGLVGRHPPLLLVLGGIFGIGAFAIYRARMLRPIMTKFFTLMGLVAITLPAFRIVSHEIQLAKPWDWKPEEALVGNASAGRLPDIYLIVLDGYGRSDVMLDIYGYDNSEFIDGLREHGFLEEHGYAIVAISTGYRMTESENADVYLREPIRAMTTLERFQLETSGAVILQGLPTVFGHPPFLPGYQAHRDRVLFEIEALKSAAQYPGPKFVLAHLLVPHPPFVFDQHGEEPPRRYPFNTRDGSDFYGTQDEYIRGYRDQVSYVDRVMLEALESVLASSPSAPIIVVMGDHGPGSRLVWDSAEQTDLLERSAILHALLLPGIPAASVYEHITPVNVFRLILDEYFGTRLGLLPDNSYFSALEQPYSFMPIQG